MLSLHSSCGTLCDGLSRRELMRIGGIGLGGLGLNQLLSAPALGASKNAEAASASARSCIVLFLMGGPPQHSTWDPKPLAPDNVRGEIAPISTSVPGVQFGALMPNLAQRADQLAVLRAVSTGDNAHSSSGYYMLTGRPHTPQNRENANPGAPNDWPNWGSVVQQLQTRRSELPAAIRLPCHIFNTDGSIWPGQDGGRLGHAADPWLFRCEPASEDYEIGEFQLPEHLSLQRLNSRRGLVRHLDERISALSSQPSLTEYAAQQQRAYGLLSSATSRGAFDLSAESPETRARYGDSQFGQSCLLARRLIEADVRLVQVNWHRGPEEPSANPCWDSHTDETARLKNVLVPPMDTGFSALLDDLQERGLLDETLIVCMAEFGRTPQFNGRAGRDHWGHVFSVSMAGGGVRGGAVHGASDELGAYPQRGLIHPQDLTATIFHALGLPPEAMFYDALQRPHAISHGRVIREILS
ncbi:MAG: DUF1501 domain-containing protein [Planctomycetaceae bacterium]|nr:DUF1501 domain-containing protein [Planctomycetaceae bacterium]